MMVLIVIYTIDHVLLRRGINNDDSCNIDKPLYFSLEEERLAWGFTGSVSFGEAKRLGRQAGLNFSEGGVGWV